MYQFVLILVLVNVFAHANGWINGRTRIVGGNDAPLEFGKFHASLQNLTNHHVCGGAIISPFHVVTAAHCVYDANPEYIKVVVGTTNLEKGGITYNVESIIIHDEFNYTAKTNDIGLLKMTTEFDFSYVNRIKMLGNDVQEGDIVFLSGFGALLTNGESVNDMQVLTISVFNQETCKYAMRYTREVTNGMFCTFSKVGQGTCNGDSGSPIIKDDKIVGLVSWGIPCARGFPDVHTRIGPYIPWLRSHILQFIC